MERNVTQGYIFHGTDKCDNGTINFNIRIVNTELIHIE